MFNRKTKVRNGKIYYFSRYQAERHRDKGERIFFCPQHHGYYIKNDNHIEFYYPETLEEKIHNVWEKFISKIKEFIKTEK